jgi:hypothetical protein
LVCIQVETLTVAVKAVIRIGAVKAVIRIGAAPIIFIDQCIVVTSSLICAARLIYIANSVTIGINAGSIAVEASCWSFTTTHPTLIEELTTSVILKDGRIEVACSRVCATNTRTKLTTPI